MPMPILALVARPPAAAAVSEGDAGLVGSVVSEAAEGVVGVGGVVVVVSDGEESDVGVGVEDGDVDDVDKVDGTEVVELELETAFPTTFPTPFKTTPLPSVQQSLSLSQQYFPSSSQMVTRGNLLSISSTALRQSSLATTIGQVGKAMDLPYKQISPHSAVSYG
jgi:hypothetical protein